jgi:hypothetical protein
MVTLRRRQSFPDSNFKEPATLSVIARSEATKQSILSLRRREMDCFAEFIIGRAFARPVGSQ